LSEVGLHPRADALAGELTAWRRRIHALPELGFEERETAAFVEQRLRGLGLEVHTGLAVTGVAGVLRAGAPTARGVLLRADMDALPIQEVAGREYGSRVAGRMHACGHDGHTAMLLGAAALLAALRGSLARDVVFCFQPAEEGPGGACRMIEDGVLDLVDTGSVYALHLWSPFEAGSLHVRPGASMAAQDEFVARIVGRGGHGAVPHANLDPIVAAAHAVCTLQAVVARAIEPTAPAVVTVGSLHAGSAPNVTPDEARLAGTLRSFDEELRARLRERVRQALDGAVQATGCRLEWELRPGYPALVNDAQAAERMRRVAGAVLGPERVHEHPPLMASEDFSYFLRERPGAFAFLGAGNAARGITAPHHSPAFDIDESVLPRGAELLARLALEP
jgi:amidohydrolase